MENNNTLETNFDKTLNHFDTLVQFCTKKRSANSEDTQSAIGLINSPTFSNEVPEIKWNSIVFIKDAKKIWTHGEFYDCNSFGYVTSDQLDNYVTFNDVFRGNNSNNKGGRNGLVPLVPYHVTSNYNDLILTANKEWVNINNYGFIKSNENASSSQFIKADGSIDDNVYALKENGEIINPEILDSSNHPHIFTDENKFIVDSVVIQDSFFKGEIDNEEGVIMDGIINGTEIINSTLTNPTITNPTITSPSGKTTFMKVIEKELIRPFTLEGADVEGSDVSDVAQELKNYQIVIYNSKLEGNTTISGTLNDGIIQNSNLRNIIIEDEDENKKLFIDNNGVIRTDAIQIGSINEDINNSKLIISPYSNYNSTNETSNRCIGISAFVNNITTELELSGDYPTIKLSSGNGTRVQSATLKYGLSGDGNQLVISNLNKINANSTNISAQKFIKNGGTADQFLKADGSIDNNTYDDTVVIYLDTREGSTASMKQIYESNPLYDRIYDFLFVNRFNDSSYMNFLLKYINDNEEVEIKRITDYTIKIITDADNRDILKLTSNVTLSNNTVHIEIYKDVIFEQNIINISAQII